MEQKFIMLCGIPGVGKSTYIEGLEGEYVVLSSDSIREELYGCENEQGDAVEVFEILHKRLKEKLAEGKSVIYDATNISRKRRKHVLSLIAKTKCKKEIVYINVDLETALERDSKRERKVGKHVIEKMYKGMHIPQYTEGWDSIEIKDNKKDTLITHRDIYSLEYKNVYKELLEDLELKELVWDRPQNNKHHSFSIDRHIFKVYEYVKENYEGSFKEELLWAAIFHDVGKEFCRETKENLYDSFIGHENVSAQIALDRLTRLGKHDKEFVLRVVNIVQNHMLYMDDNKLKKDKKSGVDLFQIKMLEFFRRADMAGH